MTATVTARDRAALYIHQALAVTLEALRASAARCPVADQVRQVDAAMTELLAARGVLAGQDPTTEAPQVQPGLPAALDVCGRLLVEHETVTGRRVGARVDVWRYTGHEPLACVEIDALGAVGDDTDQVLLADLRSLYTWLGVTPTVRTGGSDGTLTVIEAGVTRTGIAIKIGAITPTVTVDEARAALGLPAGNSHAGRAGAQGLAGPVELSPDGEVCVVCVAPIRPAGEVVDCGYGPEHPGCHQDAPDTHPDELAGAGR